MRKHSAFYQQFIPALTPEQKLSAQLLTLASDHGYTELPFVERAAKTAEVATKVGLHIGAELINSSFVEYPKAMTSSTSVLNDATKLAQATQVLNQLSDCVGELRSACHSSMKVAAALAGAVKLAQDGLIDIGDVFQVAKEAIVNGTVKLAAMEEAFEPNPGELTGPADPAQSIDVLTATLRSLRSSSRDR